MARPRQISNEQILEAVRNSVLTKGPHVSIAVIAEQLGVTAPALLKRFGTKEKLLCEALAPLEPPPWLASIEEGPTDAPLAHQMLALARELAPWLHELAPRLATLQALGAVYPMIRKQFDAPPPMRALHSLTAWFKRAAERGLVSPDEAPTMASMMLGVLHLPAFLTPLPPHSPQETESLPPALTTAMERLARSFSKQVAPGSPPSKHRTS